MKATSANRKWNDGQPLPLCSECLTERLTRADHYTGCVRCTTCRKKDPTTRTKLSVDRPQTNGSWWLSSQSRDHEAQWFDRAKREQARMCGSREFRQLGFRVAIDEVGKRRGAAS